MPAYVVTSAGPISVRQVERPDFERPDWKPEHPWVPGDGRVPWEPGGGLPSIPTLPPREEWPPLPPFLQPGVGLPIPPTAEHPMVPIPDEPDIDPPGIWPPIRPDFPDLSGKTLALALVYVSRHVAKWHWIVIDHEKVKEKAKEAFEHAKEHLKDKLPAGGVGGIPPQRPVPGRG